MRQLPVDALDDLSPPHPEEAVQGKGWGQAVEPAHRGHLQDGAAEASLGLMEVAAVQSQCTPAEQARVGKVRQCWARKYEISKVVLHCAISRTWIAPVLASMAAWLPKFAIMAARAFPPRRLEPVRVTIAMESLGGGTAPGITAPN